MAYPLNVKTRLVSFGGAATVEAGIPLHIRISTESSRSLIWVEDGYRLESLAALYMSATDGQEIVFEVPTTDQNGWLDAATRQAIIVEPGEASHLYTTKLEIFTEDHELIRTYEIGPYAVPEGPGTLDADLLNPNYDPIEGTLTTYIPGPSGTLSEEGLQATQEAKDARDSAEAWRDQSEGFRDEAEVFSATTIELQDQAVTALVGDTDSQLTGALRSQYSPLDKLHSDNYDTLKDLFDAASVNGDCVVFIRAGDYVTEPLTLTKSRVTVQAEGASIKLAPGSNANLLTIGSDALNINVIGGLWDGNKLENSSGNVIEFLEYDGLGGFRVADRSNLERCELVNSPQDALSIGRRRVEIKARRCQVRDAGRYGVYFGGTDCAFSDGAVGLCGDVGIFNNNIGNWIIGNGIYSCVNAGVRLTSTSRASYTALNMIDWNDGNGIHIEGTAEARQLDATIVGNTFLSNSQTGAGMFSDIYLKFAHAVTIVGNVFSRKVGAVKLPAHGIHVDGGCAELTETGNHFTHSAYLLSPINDVTLIPATSSQSVVNMPTSAGNAMLVNVDGEDFPRVRFTPEGFAVGGGTAVTDVNLYRSAGNEWSTDGTFRANIVKVKGTGGNGYHEFEVEQSPEPAAPTVNRARMFIRDNGAGKTELCVRFNTGAVQVIATQP